MKSLRRFFARLAGLATRRAQDERLREEIEDISLCKPAKIFEPVCHPLRRGAKPC
jgi:hypothetical protein